jgi:hypothetical protein
MRPRRAEVIGQLKFREVPVTAAVADGWHRFTVGSHLPFCGWHVRINAASSRQ